MPPEDPQTPSITSGGTIPSEKYTPKDARTALQRAKEEARRLAEKNADTVVNRSAEEKTTSPTLAERILPSNPQAVRQVADTASSMAGGFLGGGLPGMLIGGGASLAAGAANPNQAREIGSATNLSNIFTPGIGRGLQAAKATGQLMQRYPGLFGGASDALEGLTSSLATAHDNPDANTLPILFGGTALSGLLGGTTRATQAAWKNTPAVASQGARADVRGLVKGAIPQGGQADTLLKTFTRNLSKFAPAIETPEERIQREIEESLLQKKLPQAEARLKRAEITLKGAETKLTSAQTEAALKEAMFAAKVKEDFAKAKDFLANYDKEAARVEDELINARRAPDRYEPTGQARYKAAEDAKTALTKQYDDAQAITSNVGQLRQKVVEADQARYADFDKIVRDAKHARNTADDRFKAAKATVDNLARQAQSLATKKEMREEAVAHLVAAGIQDPRLMTEEARTTILQLANDPKLSPTSLFEMTIEAPRGSEQLTQGLMDALGGDILTKNAIRTRYIQHFFDMTQRGFDENVYGKTFNMEALDSFMTNIRKNSRAFNNFFENPDAFDVMDKLVEKIRGSYKNADKHTFNLRISTATSGMAAYAAGRMVSSNSGDMGNLLLELGAGVAAGVAANYLLSTRAVVNNMLQAKGVKAKMLQQFLESKDPSKLPKDVVRYAIRTLTADAIPLTNEEAAKVKGGSTPDGAKP